MSSSRTICWICYKVAAPNLKGIVRHMAAVHAHEPNFFIFCGIQGCSRTYSNFFSFKKHLYRKHRCSLEMSGSIAPVDNIGENRGDVGEQYDGEELEAFTLDEGPEQLSKFQYMKQMSLFLLKNKKVRKVSQVALDGLVADFTSMLQLTINQIKHEVGAVLQSNGVSFSTFGGLEDVFNDPQWNEPFKELDSKYLQEAFYREYVSFWLCRQL